MQIDFTMALPEPQQYGGFLEKKSSVRSVWKNRYFLLANGMLKYYAKEPRSGSGEGIEFKGELALQGSSVYVTDDIFLNISKGDRTNSKVTTLRSADADLASEWCEKIETEITRMNIIALQSGSRVPEIVSWYYQYQSDIFESTTFLINEVEIELLAPSVPGKAIGKQAFKFLIAMEKDKSGLALRVKTRTSNPSRVESLNNGRVLLFADIMGVFLPGGSWDAPKDGTPFSFVLITKEDSLSMEMNATAVQWLKAIQTNVAFLHIPKPVSRTTSVTNDFQLSTLDSLLEFSANSGAVFSSSSEVQLIIEGLQTYSDKCPLVVDVGKRFTACLKLVPDMKSNKEAACIFGDRLEDMVRTLGDQESGIMCLAKSSDKNMLNYHLTNLNVKLLDVLTYLTTMSHGGWFTISVQRSSDPANIKFTFLDSELVTVMNSLIKSLGLNTTMYFDKKEYDMAVDVRQSLEALGGTETVFNDAAKERALARLIQGDGADVHFELERLVKAIVEANGGTIDLARFLRAGRGSFSSTVSGRDSRILDNSVDETSSSSGNKTFCFYRYFCCCFLKRPSAARSKSTLKYGKGDRTRNSSIQLQESLIKNPYAANS